MVGLVLLWACGSPRPISAPLGDLSVAQAELRFSGDADLNFQGFAVGDVDADGQPDLVARGLGADVRVGLLQGQGAALRVAMTLEGSLPAASYTLALSDQLDDAGDELVAGLCVEGPTDAATTRDWPAVSLLGLAPSGLSQRATLVHRVALEGSACHAVTPAGDLDGDGREDLAVAEGAQIWLFYSVTDGAELDADADLRLRLEGPQSLGPLAHGDLDGDGVDELIVVHKRGEHEVLVSALALGGRGQITLDGADGLAFDDWVSVASGGDLNGDGRDDLVVAGGQVWVFAGPMSATTQAADAFATLKGLAWPALDLRGGVIGQDIDGDGVDELLAGATGDVGSQGGGVVALWYGPVGGRRELSEADARILGEQPGDGLALALGPGDIDQDGLGDLVMFAPGFDQGRGAVYVMVGGPR